MQRRPNVFDGGPTLYKCYTNVLCLLTKAAFNLGDRMLHKLDRQEISECGEIY